MQNMKWYYLLAISLGLAAVVAIVWVVVRSGWVMERLTRRNPYDEIEI